jgi:hypothetical protein
MLGRKLKDEPSATKLSLTPSEAAWYNNVLQTQGKKP